MFRKGANLRCGLVSNDRVKKGHERKVMELSFLILKFEILYFNTKSNLNPAVPFNCLQITNSFKHCH